MLYEKDKISVDYEGSKDVVEYELSRDGAWVYMWKKDCCTVCLRRDFLNNLYIPRYVYICSFLNTIQQ